MRYAILILCLISCVAAKKTVSNTSATRSRPIVLDYIFTWKTNNELGVINYVVQRSPTKSRWTTLATIVPTHLADSNWYSFKLPTTKSAYFYRVTATMTKKKTYQTNAIFIRP